MPATQIKEELTQTTQLQPNKIKTHQGIFACLLFGACFTDVYFCLIFFCLKAELENAI